MTLFHMQEITRCLYFKKTQVSSYSCTVIVVDSWYEMSQNSALPVFLISDCLMCVEKTVCNGSVVNGSNYIHRI